MSEVIVPFHEGWIGNKDSSVIDESLKRILSFYLWETPCENVSSSGKSLDNRGWGRKVWRNFPNLRTLFFEMAELSSGRDTLYKAKKLDDMSDGLRKCRMIANGFANSISENRLVFYSEGKSPDVLQVLFYIRCALAHGRFHVNNDGIYRFEAIRSRHNGTYSLRARMFLKEETLLEWIELLSHPADYNRKLSAQKGKVKKKIVDYIRKNRVGSKAEIRKVFATDSEFFGSVLKELKDENEIRYDDKKKIWKCV